MESDVTPSHNPEFEAFLVMLLDLCQEVARVSLDREIGFVLVGLDQELNEDGSQRIGFVSNYESSQREEVAVMLLDLLNTMIPEAFAKGTGN